MQTDIPNGKKLIKLNNKQIDILKQRYNKFKSTFESEQAKFRNSSDNLYYIVSTQYIKDWIDFCKSNQIDRYQPKAMNQDLMDAGGQLRRGLVEGQDFQIVNQTIFQLLKLHKGIQIGRRAVFVEKQKRVPIYLQFVKYLKLEYKDIRSIDLGLYLKNLILKTIQFSLQDKIQNLIEQIRENQNMTKKNKIRLWKNNQKDISMQKVYKQIKQKTRFMNTYRLDGFGKLIQNYDIPVSDLNLQDGDYFIAEVQEQYSNYFFKTPGQNKCQGCGKYRKLPFICGCKAVAYCTEQCKQKDKRFHIRDCKFAEQQQLNQQIQMIITQKSARGRVGLSNLGNTCFMNSCLQCLSNTNQLTMYFLNKYYQKEINKDNLLGSGGKLTKNYAKFIKNMWCSSQSTYSPYSLKSAVSKINPIFSGYAQHDSQQFFSFLVDGIHQDLNRVIKKPYVQSVQSKNRPDHVVALQSWIAYTQRNQSIIVDLMTGQYKSKVICPTCSMQSITFDPFTTVSLPIPQQATPGTLKFYVIFNNHEKQSIKMSIEYTKADTKAWLQTATKQLKRQPQQFLFYVLTIYQNIYNFNSTSKTEILHKIQAQNKNVFLLELSPQQRKIKQRLDIPTRFCKKSLHYSTQYDNIWFKCPFFFQKQKSRVGDVYQRIVRFLYKIYSNKKIEYNQYVHKMIKQRSFVLVMKSNKTIQRTYNRVQTDFKKQTLLEDDTVLLSQVLKNFQSNDYELDVRFTRQTANLFDFQELKSFRETPSSKINTKDEHKQRYATVTLDQCFNVFQEKQQLDPGNQWYCPNCKQHKLATKEMTIYKAPQILILHLKRFKNKGIIRKEKNQTTVVFTTVLNMKKYLIDPQPMSSYIPELRKQNKYIEPVFKAQYNNSEPIYELYAISNHFGGLGGGHYTAYAKNGDHWFQFNDSSLKVTSEESIKGSGAYILFYKRKNSIKLI